ncbi:HPt (histidine-containing phosphotransfer) domain-containing protein [Microlunatus panaciterrae]|uniref:HPt (Histidine-containing phosphotransfer) domain-containing protein n=1 Tax=Microlunatus panaciterrae TaxID=400768 RepID=A0ABS2RKE9_9ACTN|nr:hypothetical protein [Microlunatus panaciterrae]MBM7799479.1 HPt (histidine-containing phosphotransfer) domain-containing protein [Microlunatus panaciterrae]
MGTDPPALGWTTDVLANDGEIVQHFVVDYLAMLDERFERIRRHVENGDHKEALIALLSLESSSHMVGAFDLVAAARRLRETIGHTDAMELQALLAALLDAVREADAQLRCSWQLGPRSEL